MTAPLGSVTANVANAAAGPPAIFYFTTRDIDRDFRDYDFRYPLVEAWRRRGIATYFVRLARRPRVSGPFESELLTEIPLAALPGFVRARLREAGAGRPIYFDSTGLSAPATITALKLLLPAGLWCFDVHDDYVYLARGWRARLRTVQQFLLTRTAHLTVRTASTLIELSPHSIALGNASSIRPAAHGTADARCLLVMGSIDERYDFALLDRIAELAPDLRIDVWGQVSQNREQPRRGLAAILHARPNIHHFGRYHPDDMPAILARYRVALAPYRTDVRLTRYIDPLRYYDCLNFGMELITTDIPAGHGLAQALHIAHSAEDVVAVWRLLAKDESVHRNRPDRYRPITWDDRAGDFLDASRTLMKG